MKRTSSKTVKRSTALTNHRLCAILDDLSQRLNFSIELNKTIELQLERLIPAIEAIRAVTTLAGQLAELKYRDRLHLEQIQALELEVARLKDLQNNEMKS